MVNRRVEHKDIPANQVHISKGEDTAEANAVYRADGEGSGSWTVLPQLVNPSAYPVGFIKPFAGTTPPLGWSLCDGNLISRIVYARLFAAIGTSFGLGDGATTFALPDLRGRTLAGRDDMGGTPASRITTSLSGINGSIVGATGGLEQVQLTAANLPIFNVTTSAGGAHTHSTTGSIAYNNPPNGAYGPSTGGSAASDGWSVGTDTAGAHSHTWSVNDGSPNNPHNNVQPTFILNMIIYHGVA